MTSSYRLIVAVVVSPLLADGLVFRGDPAPYPEDRICKAGADFPFSLSKFDESEFVHNEDLEKVNDPPQWKQDLHQKRLFELESAKPLPDMYFYGDGQTESWRFDGKHLDNVTVDRHALNWDTHWAHTMGRYKGEVSKTMIMGVGTDTTSDLLWRLRNGEGPRGGFKPRAYILHIGLEDLLKLGECEYVFPKNGQNHAKCERDLTKADAEAVFLNIKNVLKELWKQCQAPVVLSALFPALQAWPKGQMSEAIPHLNNLLKDLAASGPADAWGHDFLQVSDCSWTMTVPHEERIDRDMSFDYLRMQPKGMVKWAECMKPTVDKAIWR